MPLYSATHSFQFYSDKVYFKKEGKQIAKYNTNRINMLPDSQDRLCYHSASTSQEQGGPDSNKWVILNTAYRSGTQMVQSI